MTAPPWDGPLTFADEGFLSGVSNQGRLPGGAVLRRPQATGARVSWLSHLPRGGPQREAGIGCAVLLKPRPPTHQEAERRVGLSVMAWFPGPGRAGHQLASCGQLPCPSRRDFQLTARRTEIGLQGGTHHLALQGTANGNRQRRLTTLHPQGLRKSHGKEAACRGTAGRLQLYVPLVCRSWTRTQAGSTRPITWPRWTSPLAHGSASGRPSPRARGGCGNCGRRPRGSAGPRPPRRSPSGRPAGWRLVSKTSSGRSSTNNERPQSGSAPNPAKQG